MVIPTKQNRQGGTHRRRIDYEQKLGHMALGAGIMALGIIIGQVITLDIEAQNNGVFDKITCRELEVVDKTGKKIAFLGKSRSSLFVGREDVVA